MREGFVFTPLDAGTKVVHVSLHTTRDTLDSTSRKCASGRPADEAVEFTFSIAVPGISADYLQRDFAALEPPDAPVECDVRHAGRAVVQNARHDHQHQGQHATAIRSTWS